MANKKAPMPVPDDTGNSLLLPEERQVCIKMAKGDAPHNHRALALLALDQGVTHADAAELSGLTRGQVRYWRDKFNQQRLGIFPKDLKKTGKSSHDHVDIEDIAQLQRVSESRVAPSAKSSSKSKAGKKKRKARKKRGKAKRKRDNKGTSDKAKKKTKKAKLDDKTGKKRKGKAKKKGKTKSKKKGKNQ
jgi:hypothetical protein